jgi:uncharacterized protein GlcG (DUF336 family)
MADITLGKARVIIRKALAKAREADFKPMAVVILDAGGAVKAFEREDDASPGRFAIAHAKAYGTIMLGVPGSKQTAMAVERPFFIGSVNGALDGKMVPVEGGVLVRDKRNKIVGAIGVSGDTSANDALVALAGIEAAGYIGEA